MSSATMSVAGLGVDFERKRQFVIGWPGDEEWIEVCWDGRITWIPGRGTVADTKRNSRFRWPAAKTSSGQPIPGTVCIEDEMAVNDFGTVTKKFDALAYCKGLASQTLLMQRGLIIVDDVTKLPAIWEQARELWEAAEDKNAELILRQELERMARWDSKGQPAPPPPNVAEISRAKEHIERRRETGKIKSFTKDDLLKALNITVPSLPSVPVSLPAAAPPEPPPEPPDLSGVEGSFLPEDPEERKRAALAGVRKNLVRRGR